MGLKNPIYKGNIYYLTITVTNWVDIFTRNIYKHVILDSLRYCQQNKNLKLYAWCLMSNHLHLVAEAVNNAHLSDILRDFKKFSSYKIIETIKSGNESRQDWMLYRFAYAAKFDSKVTNYKFWQEGNEPKEIYSNDFMKRKLNIHIKIQSGRR